MSSIISNSAIRALNRIGDIMLPRNGEFPSYSELGGVEYVDEILAYAEPGDIRDLNRVLSALSVMPGFFLNWAVKKMADSHQANGPLSATFRQLDFALRGILLSTYYSEKAGKNFKGKIPLEIIGYSLNRIPL